MIDYKTIYQSLNLNTKICIRGNTQDARKILAPLNKKMKKRELNITTKVHREIGGATKD